MKVNPEYYQIFILLLIKILVLLLQFVYPKNVLTYIPL